MGINQSQIYEGERSNPAEKEWFAKHSIKNNDINTFWNKTINNNKRLLSDIIQNYKEFWNTFKPNNEYTIKIIKQYKTDCDKNKKDYTYGNLTDKFLDFNVLHNFRNAIYVEISKYIISKDFNANSFKAFGSSSRGSDIDITIIMDHVNIAYIFAYSFGIFNDNSTKKLDKFKL